MVNKTGESMRTVATKLSERELRDAMRKIVQHANAAKGDSDRMSKEDLMKNIDIIANAEADHDWTVYYP
jgi:hypothetical protein